jgi:hypothetical protein
MRLRTPARRDKFPCSVHASRTRFLCSACPALCPQDTFSAESQRLFHHYDYGLQYHHGSPGYASPASVTSILGEYDKDVEVHIPRSMPFRQKPGATSIQALPPWLTCMHLLATILLRDVEKKYNFTVSLLLAGCGQCPEGYSDINVIIIFLARPLTVC